MFGALKPGFRSLATLKVVINVVSEKNSCGIARFPCNGTAFLLYCFNSDWILHALVINSSAFLAHPTQKSRLDAARCAGDNAFSPPKIVPRRPISTTAIVTFAKYRRDMMSPTSSDDYSRAAAICTDCSCRIRPF